MFTCGNSSDRGYVSPDIVADTALGTVRDIASKITRDLTAKATSAASTKLAAKELLREVTRSITAPELGTPQLSARNYGFGQFRSTDKRILGGISRAPVARCGYALRYIQ